MITRSQAEALLTLAESLEACERQGIWLTEDEDHTPCLRIPGEYKRMCGFKGMNIRLALDALIPKKL